MKQQKYIDFFKSGPISTKLGTKHPWVKGTQFFFFTNKDHSIIKKGDCGFPPHSERYGIISAL